MKWMWALAAPVALIACNTDVEHDVPAVDAPVLVMPPWQKEPP